MSNQENLYIHVYTELHSQRISYKNPDETWETGQCLLDFIYADLAALSHGGATSENLGRLKDLHPYFRHIHEDSLRRFFENSLDTAYEGRFCLEGFRKLQETYKEWLLTYINEGMTQAFVEKAGRFRFYAQTHYIWLEDAPAVDHFLLGFEDCLYLELWEVIQNSTLIKACKNCGRMFLPKKSNIDYCSRIYTPDGKSCQEVGYTQTFARSVKSDELLQAYTRAYKAHYARMSKPRKRAGNLSRQDFEKWYQEAKEKLNLARSGMLDPDEYKEWLKK